MEPNINGRRGQESPIITCTSPYSVSGQEGGGNHRVADVQDMELLSVT